MRFFKLNRKSVVISVTLITLLAFFLRVYQVGLNDLKEEENTTVKAAAYRYYCQQDINNCQSPDQPAFTFSNKLIALLSNNETKPNLLTANYLWDWVKDKPTSTHYSRAWPHLFSLANVYKFFSISPFSSRIISVITGTLLIPFAYYFAKYFSNSTSISLIYSFLIAIGFNFVDISRHARMYASFILYFLLAVYFIFKVIGKKKKKLINIILASFFLCLSYFLHLLTLLLPIAIYIYSFYLSFIKKENQSKKIFYFLSILLLALFYLKLGLNIDFFHTYFSSPTNLPQWPYFQLLFNYPLPTLISLVLIFLSLPYLLKTKKTTYLVIIIFTSLFYLIFFSKLPSASSYVIHLMPISLLLLLLSIDYLSKQKQKLKLTLFTTVVLLALFRLAAGFNYLYFDKNMSAKPSQAYQVILNHFNPGDQIIGIQIRDYYLQSLPRNSKVINLPENQSLTQQEFIDLIDQSPSTFIIFEKEKIVHLKPEIVDYVNKNFTRLAGEGIDNYQVEIYYLGK